MKVRLACTFCGKNCSSKLAPEPNEFGDDLVVRGVIVCPECLRDCIEIKKAPRLHPHTTKA